MSENSSSTFLEEMKKIKNRDSIKHDTNELIEETETDSQTQRTDLWLPRGSGVGEGWIGSLGLADANYYIENG